MSYLGRLRPLMECRLVDQHRDLDAALAACEQAEPTLASYPMWLAETRVYRGRALVAAGDVRTGLACALAAVEPLRHDVRVIGVAVRDALSVVPPTYRGDEPAALARYADPDPGPWEALR